MTLIEFCVEKASAPRRSSLGLDVVAQFADVTCFFLLHRDFHVRRLAAQTIQEFAARGELSSKVAERLTMLRHWMVADQARDAIDEARRHLVRAGLVESAVTSPWIVHSVAASLPDGSGAQSIVLALQFGGQRKISLLLLKSDFGVKDAYSIEARSATEQRALLKRVMAETGSVKVSMALARRVLPMALAEALPAEFRPRRA
jgi:hypothetical protein